jgi:hypothetical protein
MARLAATNDTRTGNVVAHGHVCRKALSVKTNIQVLESWFQACMCAIDTICEGGIPHDPPKVANW